ncbi:hypothetical protein [Botrimarina mediterranea]|uniref:Response regulatory domain-containing protein n=1 Tax=Botrimarina mediterranea TaxID=2528022 RepID=A0A518K3U5_9BACT|nr:hypothetical protein [Botrimarina mediterranea]QDV72461.1 hypothetical protein Spa11_06380 [Botrimarina mediterranea]QDV77032.1 hypothetical protein K2D_06180 [Planctomycetes bacterium K2D]
MATFSATSTKSNPNPGPPGSPKLTTLSVAAPALPRPARKAAPAWACLLLSDETKRRRLLEQAAVAAGWEPIPCSSVGDAIQQHNRWRTQLAVVDLATMNAVSKSAYLHFASRVASRERLLLVCDEPTDGQGEIAARQVGAWMYLPSPEFGDGLTELLSDARAIAEKISGPRRIAQRESAAPLPVETGSGETP